MENTAVLHVMEIIAATFPGAGGGSGGDQPPAFVAGEVARYSQPPLIHHALPTFLHGQAVQALPMQECW